MLNEIREMAHDHEVPIPYNHQRSEELGKISTTEIAYKDGRVLIIVRIPLVDRVNFPLYRIHSWPTPQVIGNEIISAQIAPQTRYIGLSNNHQAYFMANEEYINSCVQTKYYHLCNSQLPLYDVTTSSECEVSLLVKPEAEVLRQCDITIKSKHQPYWSRLNSIGAWLYSLDKPEILQIICGNAKIKLLTINGTGILYLKGNCVGKTNFVTLPGMEIIMSKEQYLYQPELSLNINKILLNLNQQQLIELMKEGPAHEKAKFKLGRSLYEVEQQREELELHQRRDEYN